MTADQAAQLPFYLDWKFWLAMLSLTVSIGAVILSQLPPLRILLRRARLEVEVYSRMGLTHKVGNPVAHLRLSVNNAGGKEVKIKRIEMRFRRGTEDQFTLPAQGYFLSQSDNSAVLMTSFKLKPNEEWGHFVNFFMMPSRNEEKEYRQLEAKLKHDIIQKRRVLENKEVVVSADEENVQPLVKLFKDKFRWQSGEYELTVEIRTEPAKASASRKYRITLFESDSKELVDYCDDYKFGWGIYLDTPREAVFVSLTEA